MTVTTIQLNENNVPDMHTRITTVCILYDTLSIYTSTILSQSKQLNISLSFGLCGRSRSRFKSFSIYSFATTTLTPQLLFWRHHRPHTSSCIDTVSAKQKYIWIECCIQRVCDCDLIVSRHFYSGSDRYP